MRYGAVLFGIVSAVLFGVATPLSKILLGSISQFQLAGLLYIGAGLGMLPFVIVRRRGSLRKRVDRKNALRLSAAVLFGGCMGPVFLLLGLASAHASSVSLWLNLELAATAVFGYLFFRDHLDKFGWAGVGGALLAGVLVTVGEGSTGVLPALFVALACVCWGLDNNFTALIDALTPQEVTLAKGLIAGAVNLGIGTLVVGVIPAAGIAFTSLAVGAVCYGGSIVLFIMAAQRIGAARGQILFASWSLLRNAFLFRPAFREAIMAPNGCCGDSAGIHCSHAACAPRTRAHTRARGPHPRPPSRRPAPRSHSSGTTGWLDALTRARP